MSTNAIAPTTPTASLEVVDSLPPSAIESITRGEIDIQIATAKKFPRSMAQFKRDAFEMVSMDEETAASCIYRRPVGKDPETGQQKFAEGLSIRMAEIVSACYGNIRYGAFLVEQTERMVKARGFCHDVQKNVAATSEAVEATVKKGRNGQPGEPYDERMRAVVAKAALSKAARDAVFKVVPRALCRPIEDEAKRVAIGDAKTLSSRRDAALKWCASLGVQADRVCAALGLKGVDDIGLEQLETLTGLKTSIKDGDVSVEEAVDNIRSRVEWIGEVLFKPILSLGWLLFLHGGRKRDDDPSILGTRYRKLAVRGQHSPIVVGTPPLER